MARKPTKKRPTMVFGFGLDDPKGHKRMTKGPDFRLYGGSKPTHEKMQELTVKARERLKKRGKVFATASPQEIADALDAMAHKLGLRPAPESDSPQQTE